MVEEGEEGEKKKMRAKYTACLLEHAASCDCYIVDDGIYRLHHCGQKRHHHSAASALASYRVPEKGLS